MRFLHLFLPEIRKPSVWIPFGKPVQGCSTKPRYRSSFLLQLKLPWHISTTGFSFSERNFHRVVLRFGPKSNPAVFHPIRVGCPETYLLWDHLCSYRFILGYSI